MGGERCVVVYDYGQLPTNFSPPIFRHPSNNPRFNASSLPDRAKRDLALAGDVPVIAV